MMIDGQSFRNSLYEHRLSRTGKPLTYPPFSSIRDHCLLTGHGLETKNFSIIHKCENSYDTKISESILINKDKPTLNTMESFNLNIIS